jgi:hypothetical protein
MPRLRQTNRTSGFVSPAAEVLEIRSLLSGSSAAVHQALLAAHQAVSSPSHLQPSAAVHLQTTNVTMQVTQNGTSTDFPGQVIYSATPPKVGGHMTVDAGIVSLNKGLDISSEIDAALKGTIQKIVPLGNTEVVTLKATGTLTERFIGFPKTSVVGKTNGGPLTLTFDSTGKFLSFETTFSLNTSSTPEILDILGFT